MAKKPYNKSIEVLNPEAHDCPNKSQFIDELLARKKREKEIKDWNDYVKEVENRGKQKGTSSAENTTKGGKE